MATNSYFRSSFTSTTKDQVLKENLIIEAIQIYGVDIQYMPRTYVNFDQLFGEDQSSSFNDAIPVEMYIKSVDGFGGDGNFLSKFGLEVRDEIILEISIKRFVEEVTALHPDITRPREGDLLQLPKEVDNRERLWEISYANKDYINHQLGAIQTYEIRCKVFEFGGESFNTGDTDIDAYDDTYSLNTVIELDAGTGSFIIGEMVSQENGFVGTVVSFSGSTLELTNDKGLLSEELAIEGDTSSASWTVLQVESKVKQAGLQDNDYIDEEDDGIIDFTIQNPIST